MSLYDEARRRHVESQDWLEERRRKEEEIRLCKEAAPPYGFVLLPDAQEAIDEFIVKARELEVSPYPCVEFKGEANSNFFVRTPVQRSRALGFNAWVLAGRAAVRDDGNICFGDLYRSGKVGHGPFGSNIRYRLCGYETALVVRNPNLGEPMGLDSIVDSGETVYDQRWTVSLREALIHGYQSLLKS